MELIQNGTFATGEPVYQLAEKNSDGTHTIVVFDPMTKEEAEERLKSMGGTTVSDDSPDYKSMTKLELEAMMREHGVELDRRKSKGDLLKEVDDYFAHVLHTPSKD
tara:strand:- start:544 stop:861 length:318 start_codon:yes stop_codon:yes gene_type:complete